ncbi:Uncharacterized protein FWK35_00012927 [Aphis craccivora]|uniref:Uncharacterized protein n=1 Tax=Aphis craccivora TaxID=307492 RepID=A0A6G0YC71_APHCR|nr:Uncharacterized protein FWK35_00012927 [Aphis craccivora]
MMCSKKCSNFKFGGGLLCKSEYPWCIIEVKSKHFQQFSKKSRKTKKKKDGKTGIFTQNQFSTKSIFLYGCNLKTNHCEYLTFSPNVYVIQIFTKSVENAKNCKIKNTTLSFPSIPHNETIILAPFILAKTLFESTILNIVPTRISEAVDNSKQNNKYFLI